MCALVLDKLLAKLVDLGNFRDVSDNIDEPRFNAFVRESQMREMRSFLGDALYKALIDDFTADAGEGTFTEARFTELWFGVAYTRNGFSVQFNGLKPAIVYYAYERFIYYQKLNVTRYGLRTLQDNDLSDNAEFTKKWEVSSDSMGLMYQEDSDKYLKENITLYPEFDKPEIKLKKSTGLQFFKIGQTIGR